ncbi:hypothetical protein DLH72_03350 [Candidatus Gracilibacteria bacterium]|nr:MAG: hypothetical protein DLH72_03350 [Candidatus Gracilibacteria bacterium]
MTSKNLLVVSLNKVLKFNFLPMKKIFLFICLFFVLQNYSFAQVEDDSISKELEKNVKNESKVVDFKMQTFSSCEKADELINKYIDLYMKRNSKNRDFWMKGSGIMMENKNSIGDSKSDSAVTSPSLSSDDFSKTNTQIAWVDEAEIVKTDGKYIYYYSNKYENSSREEVRYIYVLSLDKKKIVKKIKIPSKIFSVEFYLSDGKLVLLGNMKTENIFSPRPYYYNSGSSYVIVYDVSNLEKLKLEKFYTIDGYYKDSRLVGDKLYLVSNNNFSFYGDYYLSSSSLKTSSNNSKKEKFSISKSIPEKLEINRSFGNKYSMKKSSSGECSNIDFILPPEKYFEEADFSLNYNVVSTINIKNISEPVKTKVIVSQNSEMFMNDKNLYLTSNMYYSKPYICRGINCLFSGTSYVSKNSTLVNKFSLGNGNINYKKSVLIDGRPLTQYSMDEDKDGNFRILTQIEDWNDRKGNYVNFYILDKNLALSGKLEKLGIGEHFQSSRYIGDKLFLVTFERTDPLFVIDLKDSKNPKILGELKIPGYSTYLHPYDDNHLIGLGYDTKENNWGGIQNSGVKLDLYQINYDKKCGDKNLTKEENEKCEKGDYKGIIAKQLFTKTFGGSGSYTEALHNPRMFIWNSAKNKLFLPISVRDYEIDEIGEDEKELFSGLFALTIDKNTGIKQDFKISNYDFDDIEKQRQEECKKYGSKNKEDNCRVLLSGEKVCGNYSSNYIPNYCFKDSSIWNYIQNNSWRYNSSTINRALWIGENFYSLSPDKIKANNMNTGKEVLDLKLN